MEKMEQSSLMQELQRHTALFGLAKRFVAMHLTVVPVTLDLSETLTGDLAERFKLFLKNECEKVGVHWVYVCHFSPNNDYGLPGGTWIVKTYLPPRIPSPPRKPFIFSPSYESEHFYLRALKPFKIAADIVAYAKNNDIMCVVLRYYPRGDLCSRVGEVGHDVARGSGAHQKGDIYKLGKFMIALLTTIPLLDPNTGGMVTKFGRAVSKIYDKQPLDHYMRLNILRSGCSENNAKEIIGLAIQCLDTNSENRPTADLIADSLYAIKEQYDGLKKN